MMQGGWEINPELTPCQAPEPAASALSEALSGFVGSRLVPVLYCGSQVVAGMNYMFVCKQTMTTMPPQDHIVTVVVNKPLEGKATLGKIETII